MQRRLRLPVLLLLTLAAWPSQAIAPVLAALAEQLVKQTITALIQDTLLNSLRDMGCKGVALSNAIEALTSRGGGVALPTGLPALANLPSIPAMPEVPGMPGGGMPVMPGMDQIPPEMAAHMAAMMGSNGLPAIDPEQQAQLQQLVSAMNRPLSPPETLAAINSFGELGLISPKVATEMKECMVLLPQTAPALGGAMGMLKTMELQLRDARSQLYALSPTEQTEFATRVASELQDVPGDQRKAFVDGLAGGFFPPGVVAEIRAALERRPQTSP